MSRTASKHQLEDLRTISLFESCSDKELTELTRLYDEVNIEAGQVIVRQGAFGQEAFMLLSGAVTVIINGEQVAMLSEGTYFGELAPLDHSPRSATVTAVTDARLFVFGAREFATLLSDHPSVSRKLLADMAHRVRSANTAGTVQSGSTAA
jgi:CRP/FNR family transcriptional regulator, cyclic AMP receptor protein